MQPTRSELTATFLPKNPAHPVEWMVADQLVNYEAAVNFMESRAIAIAEGVANECVVLLEHPPLYSAGTTANVDDLIEPNRFPVFNTGRGGQYTYHGPGQRIAYAMLDLSRRKRDVRAYVAALENWIISSLDAFNVKGERREDRVGVWVSRPEKPQIDGNIAEDKIAAIGVRLKRWVSLHGISINVEPDLEHFSGIIPCGVEQHGVTSLVDLGLPVTMMDLDVALKDNFERSFGPTVSVQFQI